MRQAAERALKETIGLSQVSTHTLVNLHRACRRDALLVCVGAATEMWTSPLRAGRLTCQ
jgi:hypothetical protein